MFEKCRFSEYQCPHSTGIYCGKGLPIKSKGKIKIDRYITKIEDLPYCPLKKKIK